jgi:tetrahydromethanopterin:alpha-L-glutamate ligase
VAERTIAVAGIPGARSSESLAEALRAQGAESHVLPLWECMHDVAQRQVFWRGQDLATLAAVVVKKLGDVTDPLVADRLEILKQLEAAGVLVISSPRSIEMAVDRYRMTALLARAGAPIPRTVVTESLDEAEAAVEAWGRAVLKPLFTSKGRGMVLLSSLAPSRLELRRFQREGHGPFYLQEFVPSGGRDVAVAVLGGQVLGAYYRVSEGDEWMTTTAAGGHYEPCDLPGAAAAVALSAARLFDLDFTSVDLVETDAGWLVYEVSAFGGFSGLREALGVDAASLYAQHVIRRLNDVRT